MAGYRRVKPSNTNLQRSYHLTAGARFNSLRQKVVLPERTRGGEEDWVDVMLGFKAIIPMDDEWFLMGLGDIGGFGWGDSADLRASLTLGLGWVISDNWALKMGYRYYAIDYSTQRADGEFGIKGNQNGPILGTSWKN